MITASPLSRSQLRIVWAVRALLALAFGAAGAAKLAGVPQMVQVFEGIGVGQWFRYVTAVVEIGAALMLVVPGTGLFGGLLAGATMVGAVAAHLFVIGGSPVPALVLGALAAFIVWRLRPAGASSPSALES